MQVQNDSEKLFFKLILQKNFQHFGRVKFSLLTETNYLHDNNLSSHYLWSPDPF